MTDAAQPFRAALRSPVRPLIAQLEQRGVTLSADGDRLRLRPAHLVTAAERALLVAHKPAALLLLERRADWREWALDVPPPFDPGRAFLPGALTMAEVRGGRPTARPHRRTA